jgi:outer membrane protein assembly factor BamD
VIRKLAVIIICSACAFPATRKGDSPEDYYQQAMKNFDNKLWQEAVTAFAQLKAKYPYSKYASIAELRMADVKYASERWTEAVDAYHLFIQYHPNNDEVPYAMFREAMAHYNQMDNDFFVLPPAHEKDQAEVVKADQLLSEFVERYPNDTNRKEAEKKLNDTRRRLADHELYVARFYRRLGKYVGATARYEFVRTHYCGASAGGHGPDIGFDRPVLLELGQTYVTMGEKEKARPVLVTLAEQHPDSSEGRAAKALLAKL